jgi:hypothetical protein
MARARTAAIDPDALMDRPLGEISAADFLQVLSNPRVRHPALAILPDKKKYELWVEEGPITKISVRELLERLKGEKKKLELELPPWFEKINPPVWEKGNVFQGAELEYSQLVEEIANVVEERLRGR